MIDVAPRVSVAPMMDLTDSRRSSFSIKTLGRERAPGLLYVSSNATILPSALRPTRVARIIRMPITLKRTNRDIRSSEPPPPDFAEEAAAWAFPVTCAVAIDESTLALELHVIVKASETDAVASAAVTRAALCRRCTLGAFVSLQGTAS